MRASNRAAPPARYPFERLLLSDYGTRLEELRRRASGPGSASDLLELARLEFLGCEFSAAVEHGAAAFRAFKTGGDDRGAALAACVIGRAYHEGMNDPASGRGWFARAESVLRGVPECDAHGWVALAVIGCDVEDAAELVRRAEWALRIARREHSANLEARALGDLGLGLVSTGELQAGLTRVDEALAMIGGGEVDDYTAGMVSCAALTACDRAGDLERAEVWMRQAELVEQGVPMFGRCRLVCGTLMLQSGRRHAAERVLAEGFQLSQGRYVDARALASAGLALLRIDQGRLDEAAELLAGWRDRLEAGLPLVRLHLARGEPGIAATVARRTLRRLEADRARSFQLLVHLVDAELARGAIDAADAAAQDATRIADIVAAPAFVAQAALARGRVAAAAGGHDVATGEFEAGLAALSTARHEPLLARLHLELAEVLARRDPATAAHDAAAAFELCRRLGLPEQERCAALVRRLGVRIAVGAPAELDPLSALSDREREVARLLGRGFSNKEIAERLFISPKTAEHHVGSILAKLGLRSRHEVAALV